MEWINGSINGSIILAGASFAECFEIYFNSEKEKWGSFPSHYICIVALFPREEFGKEEPFPIFFLSGGGGCTPASINLYQKHITLIREEKRGATARRLLDSWILALWYTCRLKRWKKIPHKGGASLYGPLLEELLGTWSWCTLYYGKH